MNSKSDSAILETEVLGVSEDYKIPKPAPRLPKAELLKRLHGQRENAIANNTYSAFGNDICFSKKDWVPLYYDTKNTHTSDDLSITAYRAITERGEVHWLVFYRHNLHGYHSLKSCPEEAIQEAQDVKAERSRVKAKWNEVQQLARDLRMRRKKLTVTRQDAQNSALCYLGTQYFLRRIGIEQITTISGFWLAWLMLVEPQIGFILQTAAEREYEST